MSNKKILISGYYGFDNFGDDAILHVLVSELKKNLNEYEITVISNDPEKINRNYQVNSIKRFDFKAIFREMKESELYISGGGSLLQDVTSLKSLLYYLFLLYMAQVYRIKTCIFAQGIGPINSNIGRLLTKFILKKTNLITVRDEDSQNFLKSLGIYSILTADPVWNIDYISQNRDNSKTNVGIQLREWYSLGEEKLKVLAEVINNNFNSNDYKLNLISLQDSKDLEITKKFQTFLNPEIDATVISGLNMLSATAALENLNMLIGMRFHAVLVALKFNIPTLAISYDPKVESLSRMSDIPYINVDSFDYDEVNLKVKQLIIQKDKIQAKLKDFSEEKMLEARQNIDLLIKMLM